MKHNSLRSSIIRCFFIMTAVFCILVCGMASAEKTGKVKGGWLILRSTPSFSGKQISSYPTGTVVSITGQSGKWYAVKAPDGLTGYMLGNYLTISGDDIVEGKNAWVTSQNGLNVRLRSGPGTKYSPIASYAPGTKCTVLIKGGDFTQIQIGSMTGFMMTKFLTGTDPGKGSGGPVLYDIYVTSSNGGGVNLRSSPSKGNNVIGFYEVGTKGGMITPGITWSLISIDGKEGYMMTQFLTTTKPSPIVPTGSYVISFNGKNVNLRNGPGLKYTAISSFPPGTPLTVVTSGTDWSFIKISGIFGYMMTQFIITK
ncbi:MAG: SH3 domain-containing protein [Clostridia bacterium]|nr:SH3 domain-containing protein [Clostridia bacterium]